MGRPFVASQSPRIGDNPSVWPMRQPSGVRTSTTTQQPNHCGPGPNQPSPALLAQPSKSCHTAGINKEATMPGTPETCLCGHTSHQHYRTLHSQFPCRSCRCRDFSEDRDDDTALDIDQLLGGAS